MAVQSSSEATCRWDMPRLCERECGRLARARSQVCCAHCPESHTRSCRERETTRATTLEMTAKQGTEEARASPAWDGSACATSEVVEELLGIIEKKDRAIQELTREVAARDSETAELRREIDAPRREEATGEPAPEPSMKAHAVRIGQRVTRRTTSRPGTW